MKENTDMNKSNKIITLSFAVLILIIAVLVIFNINNLSQNTDNLSLYLNDEEIAVFKKDMLLENENIKELTLTQNKNGKPSVDRNLTVINLIDFLNYAEIDISNMESVKVTALDGFSSSYTKEEVLTEDFVYIMLLEDNEELSIEDGSFSMAVPSDEDSTRWIRQIYKIEVLC